MQAYTNGAPAALIGLYQIPGSNALDAANRAKATMARLAERFPADMQVGLTLDTTVPVTEGVKEIVITLVEAIGLVLLVVFVFLGSARATWVPIQTIPVSLIGTFIFFPMVGFTINTLSLLRLVLAVGLVVDDAIVVVEAVQAKIDEGLSPHDAAIAAMDEVGGAVVGIALVLSSVFIPAGFIRGITGSLYRQFALTIAFSVLLSAVNALTYKPVQCALILRPRPKDARRGLLGPFFDAFNRVFTRVQAGYVRGCHVLIRRAGLALFLLGVCGPRGRPREGPADVVHAAGGPGLLPRERPAPGGGIAPADQRGHAADRRDPEERARRPLHQLGVRVQHPVADLEPPERALLRPARALRRAGDASAPGGCHRRRRQSEAGGAPRGAGSGAAPARHPGRRPGRRRRLLRPGSRRQHRRLPLAEHTAVHGRAAQAARDRVPEHHVHARRAAALRSRRRGPRVQARRADPGRVRRPAGAPGRHVREPVQPLRARLARVRRGRAAVPDGSDGRRPVLRPQPERRHGAALDARRPPEIVRSGVRDPVQRVSRRRDLRDAGAGLQHGAGDGRGRRGRGPGPAARHGVRLERHELPGVDRGERRRPLRLVARARLPDPRGALPELVVAVERALEHPGRGGGRVRRAPGAWARQQRLRADRAHHADRALREERDPDRGVRQGGAREGCVAGRRGADWRAPAARPDPHDVVRAHLRAAAALERARRGRRGPPADRNLHHPRHAVLDRHRDLPRPRPVRRGGAVVSARLATGRGARAAGASGRRHRAGARELMSRRACVAVGTLLLLAGCSPLREPKGFLGWLWRPEVGPNYRRPPVDIPDDFRGRLDEAEAASFADLPWWEVFGDPALQRLVRWALEGNYNLQSAVASIEQARAQVGIAAADLYPQVGYQASGERQKIFFTPTFPSTTFNTFQVAFNAAWEIDVWGRIRRSTETARAQYLATEEARRGVVVTLVSDVATATSSSSSSTASSRSRTRARRPIATRSTSSCAGTSAARTPRSRRRVPRRTSSRASHRSPRSSARSPSRRTRSACSSARTRSPSSAASRSSTRRPRRRRWDSRPRSSTGGPTSARRSRT